MAVSSWMVVRLPPTPAVEMVSGVRSRAAAAVAGATSEDLSKLYGLMSGLADYLEAGHPGSETTLDLLEIWARALLISGWELEQYPELTDLVEDELRRRGFGEPKKLAPVAAELVDLFRALAEGVRDAA
jgi:type VI protein secretion system component VasA